MNFFEEQERARQKTGWLTALFFLAVVSLIAAAYFAAHFLFVFQPQLAEQLNVDLAARGIFGGAVNLDLLILTALPVLAVVSVGTIYKTIVLAAGGGASVANQLGGRLLSPSAAVGEEKQLLNIVEEMAIAAGAPPPPVYIIPDDNINAFAAGTTLSNAVIGVTRGATTLFNRDQMQGVIAHEFSHIINGDMKLNLRLTGIIHGVMLLGYIGYFLIRSTYYRRYSRGRDNSQLFFLIGGVALVVVGFAGSFIGELIRAAVSRQREFLADASAVQFTRNPLGIAGALEKIGYVSGRLQHPAATEYKHLFFADSISSNFSLSTHPPLTSRIKKILPQWDGQSVIAADKESVFAAQKKSMRQESQKNIAPPAFAPPPPPSDFLRQSAFAAPQKMSEAVGRITDSSAAFAKKLRWNLPLVVQESLDSPYSARALIYALLLEKKDAPCRRRQLDYLRQFADAGVYELTLKISPNIISLPRAAVLPTVQLTLPALRQLSPKQFELFAHNIGELIAADSAVDIFEWGIEAAVIHYLTNDDGGGFLKLAAVKKDAEYALSLLAQAGNKTEAAAVFAEVEKIIPQPLTFCEQTFQPQKLFLAMRRLAKLKPRDKSAFINAAAACAMHDNCIGEVEQALLQIFAALLDCPLPPLTKEGISFGHPRPPN